MTDQEQTFVARTHEQVGVNLRNSIERAAAEAERVRIVEWLERSPLCTCPGHALCSCGHRAPHNLIQALRRGADHG